jgi:hypothetical protein
LARLRPARTRSAIIAQTRQTRPSSETWLYRTVLWCLTPVDAKTDVVTLLLDQAVVLKAVRRVRLVTGHADFFGPLTLCRTSRSYPRYFPRAPIQVLQWPKQSDPHHYTLLFRRMIALILERSVDSDLNAPTAVSESARGFRYFQNSLNGLALNSL